MTTGSDFPPHEARGPLGQVIDTGGGIAPLVAPAPAPNAVVGGGPGVATSVATPPAGTPAPADDPQSLALLIAKAAGEMFGGASVVPMPSFSNLFSGTNVTPPGSPGISPMLTAGGPLGASVMQPAGMPSDPSASAIPQVSPPASSVAVPASVAPVSGSPNAMSGGAPVPAGGASSSFAPSGGALPHAIPSGVGGIPSAHVPSNSGLGASGGAPVGGASRAAQPPGSTHAPITPARNGATAPSIGGMPSGSGHPQATGLGATPAAGSSTGSPFGPALFEVPEFGDELMRVPVFEMPSIDASPYFVPAADAVGLEAPLALGTGLAPTFRDDPAIRDLGGAAFDPYRARADFPILEEIVHGKRLVWLDNAATTQKPRAVIERLDYFYRHENSNIHRAAHTLAARATDAYEQARATTAKFLNAGSPQEIIFVRGATEGINLIAQSWGRRNVQAGDEIVLTHLEHHANIVPWQMLCSEKGARLRIAPVDDRGDVILEAYERLLNPRTKLVAFPQVSNALGTITPAREMIEMAHRHGAVVMLDGAQAVSHMAVDVQELGCDWYVFSGHKVFAPTGIGAVWGRRELLEQMPPWQGGGNMIQDVTFEKTTYQPAPFRFEAGTGSIGDAAGLGAALDYVMKIGMDVIDRYEHDLLVYATERLLTVPGLTIVGTSPHKAGVLSFVLDGQRTEDVGAALDMEGIAVRSGHHCAQPILRRFGHEATVRASLAFYNVCEDIDALIEALMKLQQRRA